MILIIFFLIAIGAVCAGWWHSVVVDLFFQDAIWDAPIGVTISSRSGLAARNGKPLGSKIVNFIMFNKNHCEEAITADIQRAQIALTILNGK